MKKVKSLCNKVTNKALQISLIASTMLMGSNVAYATTAEAKWDNIINFILPWINRLGGVVMLIGAVEFGLAFKNDDAEAKTKGLRTIIAGAIVLAVGLSSSTFLV